MPKNNSKSTPLQPTTGDDQTVTQQRPAHIDNGDDARGSVNARTNQTRTQPEPEPAIAALGDTVIAMRPPKGARDDIFEQRREKLSGAGSVKHQLLTTTKQRLAEAADMIREGGVKAKEAGKIAEVEAAKLFSARADGILSGDELNTLLGDSFGWKAKGGGDEPVPAGDKASKTPFGQGEAIRKRVIRAVQAHEYVNGDDASKFFTGLPKEDVQTTLNRVRSGDLSIWSAYDQLGTMKRETAVKVNPAFDPKHIAKIVEALREEGAPTQFVNNPSLADAYLALRDMMVEVGREAGALAKQAA